MNAQEVLARIELGEDSTTQFKENITNNTSLAEEMVAFSNAAGGSIIIGVKDSGEICGISLEDIRRLNNMISNAASDQVKPAIAPLTTTMKLDGHLLLILDIQPGINKPYSTNSGVYITKSGADKRRISQEELQRLFQDAQKIHADELVVFGSSPGDLDEKSISTYYEREYGESINNQAISRSKILENLYITRGDNLTLAGLLVFGKKPYLKKPTYVIKAVSFVGNDLAGTSYRDSEDIKGTIVELFTRGLSFLTRNLHKRQNGKSFNSEGDLEIPKIVLEELLVNAIIHRDYFIEAAINLFIYDNRVEITSPGKLPNNLTVDNIKYGISVIRNPIVASFAAKLLPYRGIGSGIVRAIKNYEKIEFINNKEAERFTVILHRLL